MNKTLAISAIALIAVIMVVGAVSPVMADKDSNNGSNGCTKSNENSKACEKNPNVCPDGSIPNNGQCPPPTAP